MGVGGGIVLTPVLHYAMGFTWLEAVALSLFVIALQTPIGIWRHAKKGAVHWPTAIQLAFAGGIGVLIGDWSLPFIPVALLKLLFAALLAVAAWRMTADSALRGRPWLIPVFGVAAGVISRWLGVGGGILTVPALALTGTPVHVAVASSLVPVHTNAAIASGANLARGLGWETGLWLAAVAMVGSVIGVKLAHSLNPERLQRVVAAGMVVGGLLMAIDALRHLL